METSDFIDINSDEWHYGSNVPSNYTPEEQNFIMDYLFGACEYFAYALHKEFGYDMYYAMGEDEDWNEFMVHCFCIDDKGNFVDIRGITDDVYQFFSIYEDNLDAYDPQIMKYKPAPFIVENYECKDETAYESGLVRKALNYIKQNQDAYISNPIKKAEKGDSYEKV